jgi:hypothetical protein
LLTIDGGKKSLKKMNEMLANLLHFLMRIFFMESSGVIKELPEHNEREGKSRQS